jgi:hypothetical protein
MTWARFRMMLDAALEKQEPGSFPGNVEVELEIMMADGTVIFATPTQVAMWQETARGRLWVIDAEQVTQKQVTRERGKTQGEHGPRAEEHRL